MILTAGSPDALSFTDDTSLPNVGAKVSIHAQVIRELPLDWYYALLQRTPSHASELKSTVIAEVFFALPDFERRRMLSTLKTVRIHVTDPRPYTHDVDELLSDIVPGGDFPGFIKRLDRAQKVVAENKRRDLIARRMLRDAPPQQIRLKHLLWEYEAGLRITWLREPLIDDELMPYFEVQPPKEFDLTPFERSGKNVVNVLSPFLSKSESVFCEAVDRMDEVIEERTQSPRWVTYQVSRALSKSHAFDKGDMKQVQWIDGERHDVLRRIDRYGMFPVQPAPLPELDSRDSFLVQAADFAAGIGREILSRNGLPHLVDTFEYVTYNGRRISESEAVTIWGGASLSGATWSLFWPTRRSGGADWEWLVSLRRHRIYSVLPLHGGCASALFTPLGGDYCLATSSFRSRLGLDLVADVPRAFFLGSLDSIADWARGDQPRAAHCTTGVADFASAKPGRASGPGGCGSVGLS